MTTSPDQFRFLRLFVVASLLVATFAAEDTHPPAANDVKPNMANERFSLLHWVHGQSVPSSTTTTTTTTTSSSFPHKCLCSSSQSGRNCTCEDFEKSHLQDQSGAGKVQPLLQAKFVPALQLLPCRRRRLPSSYSHGTP